jgi:hypothetical protein
LLVVELNRPARADRFELLDDRFALSDGAELSEQHVPLIPGDRDDVPCDVDVDAVEPARFH